MRKGIALGLALLLGLACCFGAAAETTQKAPDFVLEGLDGGSSNHNWETNLFFARMQERTGISFQFRQYTEDSQWAERKKALLAGEDLPDVLFKAGLTASETRDLYAAGVLLDLRPYLEAQAPDLWALLQAHPDWMDAITLPDGAIPALPALNELANANLMWINTEWLGRLKLEKPTTAEELTEVLRRFKAEDPNRNGRADEIPLGFSSMWDLRFLAHAFGILDNDYYLSVRDGQVMSSLTSEGNRQFLTWLHQLWTEGLLDQNGFTTNDSLRQITDEKQAVPYGVLLTPNPLLLMPAASIGQYETLLPLTFEGRQEYRDLLGCVVRGTFGITRACAEPEKLVAWVNTLYTEEGSRLAQSGLEGEDYFWNEDGYWEWNADLTTVANQILPERTIAEGGTAPGWTGAEFQLKYAEEDTRRSIEMLHEYRQYLRLPYPMVTLSVEDEARAAELQAGLMSYAEPAMAAFVTGDTELNDESWDAFVREVEERHLQEQIDLWQKYIRP